MMYSILKEKIKEYRALSEKLKEYETLVAKRDNIISEIKSLGLEILDTSPYKTVQFTYNGTVITVQDAYKIDLVNSDLSSILSAEQIEMFINKNLIVKWDINPLVSDAVVAILTEQYSYDSKIIENIKKVLPPKTFLKLKGNYTTDKTTLEKVLGEVSDLPNTLYQIRLYKNRQAIDQVFSAALENNSFSELKSILLNHFTLAVTSKCEIKEQR